MDRSTRYKKSSKSRNVKQVINILKGGKKWRKTREKEWDTTKIEGKSDGEYELQDREMI